MRLHAWALQLCRLPEGVSRPFAPHPSASLYSCYSICSSWTRIQSHGLQNCSQQEQQMLQLEKGSVGRGSVHSGADMPQCGVAMAVMKALAFFLLVSTILLGSLPMPGHGYYKDAGNLPKSRKELEREVALPALHAEEKQDFSKGGFRRWGYKDTGKLMIGSTAPTCTYNECRGCSFKCRAEQVPVDANDPINSAYRYRCVCHKY